MATTSTPRRRRSRKNRASRTVAIAGETLYRAWQNGEVLVLAIGVVDAPRVRSGGQAVHLDRTLAVSGYQKGKSALVDQYTANAVPSRSSRV